MAVSRKMDDLISSAYRGRRGRETGKEGEVKVETGLGVWEVDRTGRGKKL